MVADEGDAIPKIDDGIWPAFPADLTSIATAVATQTHGTVMIFEKMFENRLFFVDKLVSMGARIVLCDPHRAVVSGPSQLFGERLESPDIRAGMAMLIAEPRRGRHQHRSATWARSTAATSASTSASRRSAPTSSASVSEIPPGALPAGGKDVLAVEAQELRAVEAALRERFGALRLPRGDDAGAGVRRR